MTGDGADYRGCQTKTPSNRTCAAWDCDSCPYFQSDYIYYMGGDTRQSKGLYSN